MKEYDVTFTVDATVTVKVQAENPDEAKEKAFDIAEAPMLCHCCANEVCIGDVLEDPAWVESAN